MRRIGLLLLLATTSHHAHAQHHVVDDVRQSFSIKPGDEGIQSVKLSTAEGELVTCTLKYATRRKHSSDGNNNNNNNNNIGSSNSGGVRRPSVQSILSRLSGTCIRKTIEYWKYEICFEHEIKQSHAQTQNNNLGRYSGLSGPYQLYNEGAPCSEKSKAHRKTRVEFQCDRQLRIRTVEEEPATACSYVMVVGTPLVCASPDFANAPDDDDSAAAASASGGGKHRKGGGHGSQAAAAAASSAGGGGGGGAGVEESWVLECAQVGKARVDCNARSFGNLQVSTLEFSRFDLELTSADQAVMQLEMYVARSPDRVRLSLDERQITLYGGEKRAQKVRLAQGDAFPALLEFAQLLVTVDAK